MAEYCVKPKKIYFVLEKKHKGETCMGCKRRANVNCCNKRCKSCCIKYLAKFDRGCKAKGHEVQYKSCEYKDIPRVY